MKISHWFCLFNMFGNILPLLLVVTYKHGETMSKIRIKDEESEGQMGLGGGGGVGVCFGRALLDYSGIIHTKNNYYFASEYP